jgi:hypothetical protein
MQDHCEYKACEALGMETLLCWFHVLQCWDRKMRSKEGAVHKNDQQKIFRLLRAMHFAQDDSLFNSHLEEFYKLCDTGGESGTPYAGAWPVDASVS